MNLTRAHCVATTHLQDGFRILLTRGTQKLQFIYRNSKEQVFQGISILNSLNITCIFSYRGNQGKVTYMLILNWMWLLQLIIILTEEIGKQWPVAWLQKYVVLLMENLITKKFSQAGSDEKNIIYFAYRPGHFWMWTKKTGYVWGHCFEPLFLFCVLLNWLNVT